jgi:succinyl-CoA synthetase beta subunit
MTDKSVKAILVNIFGGIMSCITIAEGILKALEGTRLTLPLVVRLEGTHVKEAKEMIAKSGLSILTAQNLAEAAEIVVKEEKKYAHSRT